MKTCPKCGKTYADTILFCADCGAGLGGSAHSGLMGSMGAKKYSGGAPAAPVEPPVPPAEAPEEPALAPPTFEPAPETPAPAPEVKTSSGLMGSMGAKKYTAPASDKPAYTAPKAEPAPEAPAPAPEVKTSSGLMGSMGAKKYTAPASEKPVYTAPKAEPVSDKPAYTPPKTKPVSDKPAYTPPKTEPVSEKPAYTPPKSGSVVKTASSAAKSGTRKSPKIWILVASAAAVLLLVVGLVFGGGDSSSGSSLPGSGSGYTGSSSGSSSSSSGSGSGSSSSSGGTVSAPAGDPLSASCDYILCKGTDTKGNTYELVANQKESSKGYEISVGVIKNNNWLYPLSPSFPFLEGGLFHVEVSMAGESGTSLKSVNKVISGIYFIDSGAFLMDCYHENDKLSLYDHYYIIFSCDTQKSRKIDCSEYIMFFEHTDATFSNGKVITYGRISSDNGSLLLSAETSGTSSGWVSDGVFRWDVLDVQSLSTRTIASGVKGVRPYCILSEGMFLCSDKHIYNTSGQSVIDLSDYGFNPYDLPIGTGFKNGTFTFEAKNDLGTRYIITIDKSGNVVSEVPA